jgi:crossover junction endodeoxyribonuclease RuvC
MILGIDPGLANTGWAVISEKLKVKSENLNERDYELVECGVMKTKIEEASAVRLGQIYEELEKIIKKFKIEVVAIETLYFAKNAKSAIKVAEAIGVIKLCGERCGLEVVGYTPLQVKMALVGYGRAEKEQVEMMVRQSLGIEGMIKPSHASDAVAVALTHVFTMKISEMGGYGNPPV